MLKTLTARFVSSISPGPHFDKADTKNKKVLFMRPMFYKFKIEN